MYLWLADPGIDKLVLPVHVHLQLLLFYIIRLTSGVVSVTAKENTFIFQYFHKHDDKVRL